MLVQYSAIVDSLPWSLGLVRISEKTGGLAALRVVVCTFFC